MTKFSSKDPEVAEIEHHLHNFEKWFGSALVPSGETHIADRMGPGVQAFTLTSGDDAFGAWVQILGSSDTPVKLLKTRFDIHRAMVTNTTSTAPFCIQIVSGESAGIAAKITAEDFTEFPYIAAAVNNDSGISDLIDERCYAGDKVWARCWCLGLDAKTLDFYHGLHEYDL